MKAIEKCLENSENKNKMRMFAECDEEKTKFIKRKLLRIIKFISLYMNPSLYVGFSLLYFFHYTVNY